MPICRVIFAIFISAIFLNSGTATASPSRMCGARKLRLPPLNLGEIQIRRAMDELRVTITALRRCLRQPATDRQISRTKRQLKKAQSRLSVLTAASKGRKHRSSSSSRSSARSSSSSAPSSEISSSASSASPLALFSASRQTGLAPLGVFFDVVGDVNNPNYTWAEVENSQFDWDFGAGTESDLSSRNDPNLSPRYARGYMAAHVFETPGQYDVTLTLSRNGQIVARAVKTIVVSGFTGRTLCVSAQANFDRCPSESPGDHFTDISQAADIVSGLTGSRLLLHSGESFTLENKSVYLNNGLLGAYGEASAGRPTLFSLNMPVWGVLVQLNNDSRLSGVDLSGDASGGSGIALDGSAYGPVANNLVSMYGNSLVKDSSMKHPICFGGAVYATGGTNIIANASIEDIGRHGLRLSLTGCPYQASGIYADYRTQPFALINSKVDGTQRWSLRIYDSKILIANSEFGHAKTNPVIRFHTNKWALVTNSRIVGETDGFGFGRCCDSSAPPAPENIIYEKNTFIEGTRAPIFGYGKNVVIRNNIGYDNEFLVQLGGYYDNQPTNVENVSIYGNTLVSHGTNGLVRLNKANYSNLRIHDNLVYGPVYSTNWKDLRENVLISADQFWLPSTTSESHNLYSFPMAPAGADIVTNGWDNLYYTLAEWQALGQGAGTGTFDAASSLANLPKFGERLNFNEKQFSVTVRDGAVGTELVSDTVNFENLAVWPFIRYTLYIDSADAGPSVFDCDRDGQRDQNYNACRYQNAVQVIGNTIVMGGHTGHYHEGIDVLAGASTRAQVTLRYSPHNGERIYTLYPDKYAVGDSLTYYDGYGVGVSDRDLIDWDTHIIQSKGSDSNGSYFVVSPPLKGKAKQGGVVYNWGANTNKAVDFTLKPGSKPINAGLPLSGLFEDHEGRLRSDGIPDVGALEYQP